MTVLKRLFGKKEKFNHPAFVSDANEARTELSPMLFLRLSSESPRNLVGHLKKTLINSNSAPVQCMLKVRVTDPVTEDEFETIVTGLKDYRTILHHDAKFRGCH